MADTSVPRPKFNQRIVDENGIMSREFMRFLTQLWERTGGANDDVGGSLQSENNLLDVASIPDSRTNLGFVAPILDKASPGNIGGTAAAIGNFTTVNATNLTMSGVLTVTGKFTVDAAKNVTAGAGALGLADTDGFFYIPTVAGTPTGTPATKTGFVPMVYDTTNDELYVFNGGWRSAVFT